MPKLQLKLRGFKSARQVIEQVLGELERQILEHLWQHGEASVREVYEAFGKQAAYTTLMTTLDRLYKKGLLHRRKEGKAFLYSPRYTEQQFTDHLTRDVIHGLLDKMAEPALSCFVDAVSEKDKKLLDKLEQIIREKRLAAK
jgi:predicted transcriptional regulator